MICPTFSIFSLQNKYSVMFKITFLFYKALADILWYASGLRHHLTVATKESVCEAEISWILDAGSLLISLFSEPDRKKTWGLPSLEKLTYLVVNECICSFYPFSRKVGWALYMANAAFCFFRWSVFISCCIMIWKHTQYGMKNGWEPEEFCIARLIVVHIVHIVLFKGSTQVRSNVYV